MRSDSAYTDTKGSSVADSSSSKTESAPNELKIPPFDVLKAVE